MAMPDEPGPPRLVLIGYSKGAPDILEAIVAYPEIRSRVAAVVSAAGSIGGSALANDAEQYQADLLRHFPGATCALGRWRRRGEPAARNAPEPGLRNTLCRARCATTRSSPFRSRSAFLRSSSRATASSRASIPATTARSSSTTRSSRAATLVGYLNADHWALAVPINRTHDTIGSMFVTQNAYPREALLEALLRFVEEDLARQ